ncbi:Multiple RNA-binding domain-containing protein 1 [Serendipita sp. 399]|nr:Multiple RNA-binding domain-containing protein 1 [Serendipita sp. 399]
MFVRIHLLTNLLSRIIVKNLPTYITEPLLRKHFSSQSTTATATSVTPELTDVRIVHKKDGSTRRIAFIGYKSEEQAQAAVAYFDKTYLDVSKLRVEIVNGTKDAPIRIRDGKRTREDQGGEEPSMDRNGKRRKVGDAIPIPAAAADNFDGKKQKGKKFQQQPEEQFEAFQKVMGTKRNAGRSWANEEEERSNNERQRTTTTTAVSSAAVGSAESAKETKRRPVERSNKANKENDTAMEMDDQTIREEAVAVADQDQAEEVSDMEWMRRKMQASRVDLTEEKVFEQSDEDEEMHEVEEGDEKDSQKPSKIALSDPTRDAILSNGRLFVRNLVFSCTEQELSAHFTRFGDIEQVHLPVDANSNPKGFGYVRFKDPAHALDAYEALDKTSFQGRLLHILPGVDRQPRPSETNDGKGEHKDQGQSSSRLKDVRAQKRKEKSGKEFNWAVLYMNRPDVDPLQSDAVANSIADRLGVAKADILNPDASGVGGSPAVKLALAETHIIAETKKYLEQNNVDLSLFAQQRLPRSKTIILVKNIPYGVASSEIEGLFKAYGSVRKVLFPPAGTIAIVVFAEGNEKQAADAWRGLAYKRLKDSILYLEWAPQGLLDGPAPAPPDERASKEGRRKESSKSFVEQRVEEGNEDAEGEEEAAPPGATLHIGNLSFATTSERLSSIFRHLPSFAFAKVATKVDPNRAGETLSQGFGFVGFKSVDAARQAMKGFSSSSSSSSDSGGAGLVLDGHVLKISFAGRGKEEMEKETKGVLGGQSGKAKGTKLIVKNLAFEVTKKELWELFNAHGQVKSVRLPNRADRRSRGFAFVDFASRKEAENAMEQLRHSHLLGRHLVMDWAKKEEDVEEMRLKTMLEYASATNKASETMGRKEKLRFGLGGTVDAESDENE